MARKRQNLGGIIMVVVGGFLVIFAPFSDNNRIIGFVTGLLFLLGGIGGLRRTPTVASHTDVQNQPLDVQAGFFEARCPKCGLKQAVFRDDTDYVSCTCGARLKVERDGQTGRLQIM